MYIVIEIQNGIVGGNKWEFRDPNKTDKQNLLDALSKYHSILAVAAVSSVGCHACVVINGEGSLITSQVYTHGAEQE